MHYKSAMGKNIAMKFSRTGLTMYDQHAQVQIFFL